MEFSNIKTKFQTMESLRIFIVEDDAWLGELLKRHLALNPDHQVHLFKTAKECLDNMHLKPDIISIDFGLPDMPGDELLKKIQSINRSIPVIVTSGQEDVSVAVNFLKEGARDYIVKNENVKDMLWNSILKIRENIALKKEVEELKEKLEQKYSFGNSIIGQSEAIRRTFPLLEKAIGSNINVSINGETGTGKEVYAKAIHYNSERKKKPFIAVNMSAIPAELMESELFGYEKGAFTGAQNRKTGKFEEANGGTLFLDEIAELDLTLQSKLLRALQEREITRLGGHEKIKFDARLITATHRNLAEYVKQGKFREDLYYRIIGMPILLPPLRERGNDVLVLAKFYIENFARENKLKAPVLSPEAREKLLGYNYPGNVRELKSVVELALVMSDGKLIHPGDITFNNLSGDTNFTSTEKTLREHTVEIISYYLKKYDNDVLEVARKLDIGKSTIYNMIQKKEIAKNNA
jgi:DNA-binding NtrC family response regulator